MQKEAGECLTIKVMSVFGTRPEAIKMAPLVKELEADPRFQSIVVVTAQHREMLDQVLEVFAIEPDYDLDIMTLGQTLTGITTKVLLELEPILHQEKPSIVLVHGDTTTAYAAATAAFYAQIPIGHVEAGLRTWNKRSPYPEEANRQLIDVLADLYFAPTLQSKENLLAENHDPEAIFVTGNTAIDAMRYTVSQDYQHPTLTDRKQRKILLTMHRRENPKVREIAQETLGALENVTLIEPLDVIDFHNFANQSTLILTDSGGVQEEAPSLGVPVLVLRDTTERPEGIAAGTLKLVGTGEEDVYQATKQLLQDHAAYTAMAHAENPYGDGKASQRIKEVLAQYYRLSGMANPSIQ